MKSVRPGVSLDPIEEEDGEGTAGMSWGQPPAPSQAQDENINVESQEVVAVRAKRIPNTPSLEERRQHEILCEPYRSWCRACVAGRGLAGRHVASQSSQEEVPVVALDYGYLGDREDANPIICGHDSEDKWFYGLVVESKGASQQYAWKELAEQIGRAGHPKLSIQTDNEPAIIALKEAVIKYLTQHFGQKVIDRGARLKDSQANGRAEMAVREVKAKSRVFLATG